jgi:glucosamine-6-phosphate deaminase
MEVIVARTAEEMSRAAAAEVVTVLNAKPNGVLGMATGSTPLGLYQELVRRHKRGELDFSHVTTFNLDEYVGLPITHPQSYHQFMHENFFRHVNIPPQNIHIPSGTTTNYPAFCAWYEQRIREAGGIDLQILGIGSDGHIAFNEPGSSLSSRTRLKTLAKPTIDDNARECILLATGANKATAIAAAVEGPVTSMITASALQMHPSTRVYVDEAAASKLKMRDYYEWIQEKKPGAPAHERI